MTAHDANIGRRVGGRFVVEAPLGAGGMGSIYRGRDERLGEPVAIKFLKHAFLHDSVLRERFRREALSLAKLRHPGIVTVLDFGETAPLTDNGEPPDPQRELYTVLELVRGTTLDELMGTMDSGMPTLRAAPIFDQILAALEVCHDNDVVHRDIKPSNVMVSTVNGVDHVTIIDFGLARIGTGEVDKLTETGTVQGTPHYMAPEQCRGEEVGPKTDVYATGVLFYEVLAGKGPFEGKDAATFMAQHLFVDPHPLREVAPHLSGGIEAAVHGAPVKQPQDRPTARELRDALAAAFKGTDPHTRADAAALERRRVSGLSRSERAITGRPVAPIALSAGGTVLLWLASGNRTATLRGCLGTAGLSSTLWTRDEVPDVTGNDVAVVVSVKDGSARIRQLREASRRVAIVVIDVGSPEETTESIRAGASDMLLSTAPDADLAPKIKRLLRRRMRS